MIIGIVGYGFVGQATEVLRNDDVDLMVYDTEPEKCNPLNTTLCDVVKRADVIFVSVPTPMNKDGSCNVSVLDSVINEISLLCDLNEKIVVIRSTVPCGTSTRLNCYFMPEFLTEKNFLTDFKLNKHWIFGMKDGSTHHVQNDMFMKCMTYVFDRAHNYDKISYNHLVFIGNDEAEMVKLFRNTFLSVKVSFCNEMYQFCQQKNINYEVVRACGVLDDRITESHTCVPGHDGHFGYGGTCFPKDMNNLNTQMRECGMKSFIINSAIERNETVDRPEKDWFKLRNRAVSD
jgi:nucleotide sugar dehydrogenase